MARRRPKDIQLYPDTTFLAASEAGKLLGITGPAITRYARLGQIDHMITRGRMRIYSIQDVLRFKKKYDRLKKARAGAK